MQKAFGTPLQQDYATYSYTSDGKMASMTDANGNLATMTYDGFDRIYQWNFPLPTSKGQVNANDYEAYQYDQNGNRTYLRKRDGTVLTYSYDALNRMIQKNAPASATGAASYSVFYGYDVRGLQTYARIRSSSGAVTTNTYDGFGQLDSTTTNMGG